MLHQLIGSEFILMNELGFSFPKVEFSASCSDAAAGMRPDKALPPGARESCMPSERGRGTPRPPEPTSLSAAFQFRIRGRFGVLRKVSGGRALRPLTSCPSDVMMSAGAAGILPGWTDAGSPAPLRSFAEFGAIPLNSALGRPALGCGCVPRTGVKRRSAVCFPLRFLPFLDGLAAGAAQTGTGLCRGWKRWRAVAGFAFQPAVPHRV